MKPQPAYASSTLRGGKFFVVNHSRRQKRRRALKQFFRIWPSSIFAAVKGTLQLPFFHARARTSGQHPPWHRQRRSTVAEKQALGRLIRAQTLVGLRCLCCCAIWGYNVVNQFSVSLWSKCRHIPEASWIKSPKLFFLPSLWTHGHRELYHH